MIYGILIKKPDFPDNYEGSDVGDVFTFEGLDTHGRFADLEELAATDVEGIGNAANYLPQSYFAEISEKEYNRLNTKSANESTIHPKLLKAYESGDFGCQSESVKGILEAITEILKEEK